MNPPLSYYVCCPRVVLLIHVQPTPAGAARVPPQVSGERKEESTIEGEGGVRRVERSFGKCVPAGVAPPGALQHPGFLLHTHPHGRKHANTLPCPQIPTPVPPPPTTTRPHRFSRSFMLPKNVNDDGVSAQVREGVLTVTLPKKEEEEPQHKEVPIA